MVSLKVLPICNHVVDSYKQKLTIRFCVNLQISCPNNPETLST